MKKKLALLMAAVMTVAMVPMTAFASTKLTAVDEIATGVGSKHPFTSTVELVKNDDRVVAEIYGNTDSYSKYNKNNRLEASLLFKPIGPLYNDEDARENSAAFSVDAGQLTIDNDVYQKNVTIGTIILRTINGNTKKPRDRLFLRHRRGVFITLRPYVRTNGASHHRANQS